MGRKQERGVAQVLKVVAIFTHLGVHTGTVMSIDTIAYARPAFLANSLRQVDGATGQLGMPSSALTVSSSLGEIIVMDAVDVGLTVLDTPDDVVGCCAPVLFSAHCVVPTML